MIAPDSRRTVALRGGTPVSADRFRADVGFTAADLRRRGCRRAALVEADGYLFAVGLFGLLAAGAEVVLPANGQKATLAALVGEVDLLVGGDGLAITGGDGVWDGGLDAAACRLEFFTSGSSGATKRVVRTLAELLGEVAVLEAMWGVELGAAPVFATVSHQHIFGLTFRLLWPLVAGRPFAAEIQDLWEGLLAALPDGAALISSPAHLGRLGGLAPSRRMVAVFSAGAPLSAAAAADAARVLGAPPIEIYGSTETGAIASRRRHQDDPPWTPLPGNRVTIGGDGRLRLRSPYVGDGGWVETQDRAEPSGDGFRLLGRADRVAKIEGKRIGLDEVEAALAALPEVAEAAVTILDEGRDVLAAVVVPSAAGRAELVRLGAFRLSRRLRAALAASQDPAGRPRRWRFVEAIPAGAMGKRTAAVLAAAFQPTERPKQPRVTAVRPSAGAVEIDLAIEADLFWFDGHFPGDPILPGVVQLDWAMAFARSHLGLTQPAARRFQIKFKATIRPGEAVTLALRLDAVRGRLGFDYRRGGAVCSTGTVTLERP